MGWDVRWVPPTEGALGGPSIVAADARQQSGVVPRSWRGGGPMPMASKGLLALESVTADPVSAGRVGREQSRLSREM